jgi:hypothetical protein
MASRVASVVMSAQDTLAPQAECTAARPQRLVGYLTQLALGTRQEDRRVAPLNT